MEKETPASGYRFGGENGPVSAGAAEPAHKGAVGRYSLRQLRRISRIIQVNYPQ